jgi:hypothetical protein
LFLIKIGKTHRDPQVGCAAAGLMGEIRATETINALVTAIDRFNMVDLKGKIHFRLALLMSAGGYLSIAAVEDYLAKSIERGS